MNSIKGILLLHFLLLSICTLVAQTSGQKYDIVVAVDGSGKFKTIQEAINASPDNQTRRTVIFVKKGVYKEKVVVAASKKNLTFIGEDLMKTIITYDDFSPRVVGKDTIKTNTSFSFAINADGFIAENITFENSAGNVGQAVAVRIISDKVIFKNCRFIGNQDTLLVNGTGRVYFSNCYIEGTTDFIFGSAIALFEDCRILSKKNSFVTAASTPQANQYGYVFKNCTLQADSATTTVFLGRPWRPYAKVVYIDCWLGKHIRAEGWDNWRKADNEKTAYYAEYKSKGPGANPTGRVAWSHQLTDEEVMIYSTALIFGKTVGSVPYADNWLPAK
jgi:pectinesterase